MVQEGDVNAGDTEHLQAGGRQILARGGLSDLIDSQPWREHPWLWMSLSG